MANTKVSTLLDEIMQTMEQRGFVEWEAREVPRLLEKRLEENSRRKADYKPFTVFKEG